MLKVRQYLHPFVKDAETVTIMVKAYANLNGLAQACVKNGKLKVGTLLTQFVIGFNRRYPLFDFVDVGPGKEEADNKLRGMASASSFHGLMSLTDILQMYSTSTFPTPSASTSFLAAIMIRVTFRS